MSALGVSPAATGLVASPLTTASLSPPVSSSPADGASQKDKDVLCEFVNISTPDGKTELIKNARVQFVYGRRYGLIGPNGKVSQQGQEGRRTSASGTPEPAANARG